MGQFGRITLVNGTYYAWRLDPHIDATHQVSTNIIPHTIAPGQTAEILLDFQQGLFTTRSDTQVRRVYKLEGTRTNCSFQLLVTDDPSSIRVTFDGFSTPGHPSGSEFDLGWVHDGSVHFILSGSEGCFSSNHGPVAWMQENLRKLGHRPLYQLCLPGTRNSGMSTLAQHANDVLAPWLLCQSRDVYGQLLDGARYLDIRPVIGAGELWTGYYGRTLNYFWMGDRGQRLRDVVDGINRFTARHKELVIVNLSHAINTDVGATNYCDLSQNEWDRVFDEFARLNDRFIVCSDQDAMNLTRQPLRNFIGDDRAAVIIVVEAPNVNLGKYEHQGFFTHEEVNVHNDNPSRDDCHEMTRDQLRKLDMMDSAADPRLFMLSWTLTPQVQNFSFSGGWDAQWHGPESKRCVRNMAYSANKELFLKCLPHCYGRNVPNILFVDFLEGRDFAALAMAVNDRCFPVMHPREPRESRL
ncbi:Glucanbeta-glucosidase [Lasiodiplodia theobromae]|uniref:Glucanbeta-glucosidase n=1 Tax=Lasiodiplodia theobromae TaxID=45133 RepID=UPI0015C31A09|nr:Glucanbeta-glucosidase [Lasiodiplodia theobromae]KAF4534445.1 Glucanbeta-glucosidase [Lasiodiplodia theobromae]